MPKRKPQKNKKKDKLVNKKELLPSDSNIVFSFSDFDSTQGTSIKDFCSKYCENLLERFQHYSKLTISTAQQHGLTIYGNFPKNSEFNFPSYVSPEANWAKFDLGNVPRIIGHIVHNIFFVIFFDGDHQFFPSEKKNT